VEDEYADQTVRCTLTGVEILHYYFPAATTRYVTYDQIRALRRVDIGALTGRARIWGTANLKYWANLDTKRIKKTSGLVIDTGGRVQAFITPDDCNTVERIIRERSRLPTHDVQPDGGFFI
jgi:hypothetical protein